ncbi:MAG: YdcF family protein [Clostridia bacterium]|nr:YdcF family protein [Clostridia bacterium]
MRKHWRKLAAVLAVCMLVGIGGIAGVNAYMIGVTDSRILTVEATEGLNADCILVLGCGIRDEVTPSALLADRLEKAVEVYALDAAPKLLMSGDHGRADYDEVNVMKACAVKNGVAADNVFMDHAGFSTYESMYRAKEIFGAKKVLIVTQRYHLYRALYIARTLGLEAYGCPAREIRYYDQIGRDVREIAARCKDFVYAALKPLPTYLGAPVSLAGSGSVTDDAHTLAFA